MGDTVRTSPTRRGGPDLLMVVAVLILALGGCAISASARAFSETMIWWLPKGIVQGLAFSLVGILIMAGLMLIDYRTLTRPGFLWAQFLGICTLLLVVLSLPEVANTSRFIAIGGMSLQPSEFAKPVLVLVLAVTLAKAGDEIRTWQGLSRPLFFAATISGLILAGKDLGGPTLLFAVTLALAVAAGARWMHVGILLGVSGLTFGIAARMQPYRWERLENFVHAWGFDASNFYDISYQLRQSLMAVGSGGIGGKGFGLSTQKAHFLPAGKNDFVFGIFAEELGLIGGIFLIGVFLFVAWRGHCIAERAADAQGRLIALGATWLVVGQALVHIAIVVGLLPTKGLPLPFVSTGGSAILAFSILMGLVLNVSMGRRSYGG